MKIANVEEMRQIEQETNARGHSYGAMMEMAGRSVADVARALMLPGPTQNVLILVGPGNNGGDGLVAGYHLLEAGHQISLYIWKRDIKGDENFRRLKRRRRGISILWADNDPEWSKLREEVQRADLIVDALLGTGVARPIEGRLAELLAVVREEVTARRSRAGEEPHPEPLGIPRLPLAEALALGVAAPPPPGRHGPSWEPAEDSGATFPSPSEPDFDEDWEEEEDWEEDWEEEEPPLPPWPRPAILAVDCPSGLNCDTGALDRATLPADVTVTFGLPKWGQLQFPGAGVCGLLAVADIGVPPDLLEGLRSELITPSEIRAWLPRRPANAHKGTFGKAMIVAGSLHYTGAAHLSGAAATRAGAGLVTLAIPACLHPVLAGILPDTTWLPLADSDGTHSPAGLSRLLAGLEGYDALLVGPGLTTSPAARELIEGLFGPQGLSPEAWARRTVVDADALNILATLPDWPGRLPRESILTPHPGEMARLTGKTVDQINGQRIAIARSYAAEWGHVVLLKGPHTVIAAPDGRCGVLPFALPTLATAGSGDVLAGAIVAMLAQGLPPFEAAVCGGYLHGHAGLLLLREFGPSGSVAHDIMNRFPHALQHLYTGP